MGRLLKRVLDRRVTGQLVNESGKRGRFWEHAGENDTLQKVSL